MTKVAHCNVGVATKRLVVSPSLPQGTPTTGPDRQLPLQKNRAACMACINRWKEDNSKQRRPHCVIRKRNSGVHVLLSRWGWQPVTETTDMRGCVRASSHHTYTLSQDTVQWRFGVCRRRDERCWNSLTALGHRPYGRQSAVDHTADAIPPEALSALPSAWSPRRAS